MTTVLNSSTKISHWSHQTLLNQAIRHVHDIISIAFEHDGQNEQQGALVVFDTACPLANILIQAYKANLPYGKFIDFDLVSREEVLTEIHALKPRDLIVLIQSSNFRLEAFRMRIELFKLQLKVIEHPHLNRMNDDTQVEVYIDALAYDPNYFRRVGHALKQRIDTAQYGVVDSGELDDGTRAKLIFNSPFENAKLNVGDYSQMTNWGGMYPIGEVFTEAQDLMQVSGKVRIFIFGDTTYHINHPSKPITLIVEKSRVVDVLDSTPDFDQVLSNIRADEGEVWVRELGLGLNRALSVTRQVNDVGTFERMCGIHLSLGAKHGTYQKSPFKRAETRHHIDVFAITEQVLFDKEVVFVNGKWIV